MKKYFLFAAAVAIGLVACNTSGNKLTNKYSDEELSKAIVFVGQGKTVNYLGLKTIEEKLQALGITVTSPMRGTGGTQTNYAYAASLNCKIATKKSGCKSGISLCDCSVVLSPIDEFYSIEDNYLYFDANKVDFNKFTLELAEKPNIDMSGVQFVIEDNVRVFDENGVEIARIYAGEYPYTPKTSEFGGFELNSAYVK